MADISSIKLPNGTTYTVKDSETRKHIGNKSNPHGVTADQIGLGKLVTVPTYRYDELNDEFGTTGSKNEQYLINWIKKVTKSCSISFDKIVIGSANPNSIGIILFKAYEYKDYNNTGMPRYCDGLYLSNAGQINIRFGVWNGIWMYKELDEIQTITSSEIDSIVDS
jgi:hypothetical protein